MNGELIGRDAAVSLEVLNRGRREREFFNRYTDEKKIPDRLLLVPPDFDVPEEVRSRLPQLKGKAVCDYGCGYGVAAAFFALHGAVTFALDVAEANIRVARRAASLNGVGGQVFFEVMQGEYLGFPDNYFDLIFGNSVLHHMDIAMGADEVYRVLKPGGLAVFVEPLGESRLLEWARRCRLRSARYRHTEDERSLLYSDLETLRRMFDEFSGREMVVSAIVKSLFRKEEAWLITVPRGLRALRRLERWEGWVVSGFPSLRPLASHVVLSLYKKPGSDEAGDVRISEGLQAVKCG